MATSEIKTTYSKDQNKNILRAQFSSFDKYKAINLIIKIYGLRGVSTCIITCRIRYLLGVF